MGLPQPKMLHGREIREKIPALAPSEPARPIESVQGEVAAMQSLIASRLTQQNSEQASGDAESFLEQAISSISRLSGYAAMGLALGAIAFLIF
ncbi:MAG: hypothetical protein KA533_02850 [Sphingobium sp.]|nr:hypothetical protein [Sphingobium sp.]MBP8669825.1 hypothetical protein [Sphingobium sp.]MBP9156415.1 hypothetical protein [Sphingobium sp.]MCC6483079.1 hypothetical protein [Sphingomonadaceae bacterium]